MALFDKVKVGNVEVRIYKFENRGKDYLVCKYHWAGEPKLKSLRRKSPADDKKARAMGHEIASAIYNNRAAHISEIGTGTHVLKAAEDALTECGIAVDAACREYAQARKIIGPGGTILQAAELFARSQPKSLKPIKLPDAVEEMLEQVEADSRKGTISHRHFQDTRSRLRMLAREFPEPIAEVTAPQIRAWFRSLSIAPRTQNNLRERIVTLFRWAQEHGYLLKNVQTEADALKAVPAPTIISIFPVEQFRRLLYGAVEHEFLDCIPYLTIGTFAFVRPKEMERMTGSNIRFQHNDIEVSDAQAKRTRKKRHRRLVPMQPNLRAWLEAYPVASDKPLATPGTRNRVAKLVGLLNKKAEKNNAAGKPKIVMVKWHHDVMRHSGISYTVALTSNVDQVALWAGNSRKIIYESYLSQVTPSDAADFYSILPPEAKRKIIRFGASPNAG